MAFEFLSNLDTTTTFLLLIIFILFVLAMKKILGIIKNAIIIAVAAVLFPIVMNRFFGYDIPMDPDSIISFMLLGLGIYFAYLVAKSIYKMLSLAEKAAKKITPEKKPKESEKQDKKAVKEEKADYKKEKEWREREKELKEREKELSKKEQEIAWYSTLEKSKPKPKNWTQEYAEIKEPITREKERPGERQEQRKVSNSHITSLPVIEHKAKKKKKPKK